MTPARGRETIDFVRASFRVSIRQTCRTVPACRATYHYGSRRPEQAPLIREIARHATGKLPPLGSRQRASEGQERKPDKLSKARTLLAAIVRSRPSRGGARVGAAFGSMSARRIFMSPVFDDLLASDHQQQWIGAAPA
jgi:hypothetical protein